MAQITHSIIFEKLSYRNYDICNVSSTANKNKSSTLLIYLIFFTFVFLLILT